MDIITSDIIGVVISILITTLFFIVMKKRIAPNNEEFV